MKKPPYVTVIMPVFRATGVLPKSLGALMQSDLPREDWELVIVDDASPDETPVMAAQYADVLVRLAGKPRGPAYARNRGFEVSRGSVIVFVDADVVVHTDTLRKFADYMRANPDVASVFGSYDVNPSGSVVSQFRNLMHHYVHHRNSGEAETFWAGCGAIRAAAFAEVGMFDEWHFSRPQIEDIELGRRLRTHGHRIVLRPEIQGTHLKRWTFVNMVTTDLQHRGVPWMWLLLKEGPSAGGEALNLQKIEKLATALVGLAGVGLITALVTLALWPLLLTFSALFTVVFINRKFYMYLRRQRTTLFALQSIPLHLCCYVVNGLAALSGSLMHLVFGTPTPPAEVSAQAELGIKTWPPGPTMPRQSTWNVQPGLGSADYADERVHEPR